MISRVAFTKRVSARYYRPVSREVQSWKIYFCRNLNFFLMVFFSIAIHYYFAIHDIQDLGCNTTNSHSPTYPHLRTSLHRKVTPIWAWHILSYSTISSIYIARYFLNMSKLLFFVQMYFSVSYFNFTFVVRPRILGSSLFLLHAHK